MPEDYAIPVLRDAMTSLSDPTDLEDRARRNNMPRIGDYMETGLQRFFREIIALSHEHGLDLTESHLKIDKRKFDDEETASGFRREMGTITLEVQWGYYPANIEEKSTPQEPSVNP